MPLPPRPSRRAPRAARPTGEKYAFVTLPYAEFVEGTINEDNIGFGALCPLPAAGLPADALVHGLVIFSKRSAAISAWLTGIDLVFVKASLETREVLLEVALDTQRAQRGHTRPRPPPPQPPPGPRPQGVTRCPPPPGAQPHPFRPPPGPAAADLSPSRGRGREGREGGQGGHGGAGAQGPPGWPPCGLAFATRTPSS